VGFGLAETLGLGGGSGARDSVCTAVGVGWFALDDGATDSLGTGLGVAGFDPPVGVGLAVEGEAGGTAGAGRADGAGLASDGDGDAVVVAFWSGTGLGDTDADVLGSATGEGVGAAGAACAGTVLKVSRIERSSPRQPISGRGTTGPDGLRWRHNERLNVRERRGSPGRVPCIRHL